MTEVLQAPLSSGKSIKWKEILWLIGMGAAAIDGFFHFAVICKTAVDIPYLDEWELFRPVGIVQGWSMDFIFGFQNEHRSFLSKILLLLNYHLFHLNFRYQIIFNFILYFSLLLTLWKLIGSKVGPGRSLAVLFAFIPFLSPLLWEIHTMGFVGGKHLYLLSFVLGTYFLFIKENQWFFLLAFLLLMTTLFSYAGGIGGVVAVSLFFAVRSFVLKDRGAVFRSMLLLGGVGLAVFLWLQGYQKPDHTPGYSFPWSFSYLRYLGELISLGFGFTQVNSFSALLCGIAVLIPAVLLLGSHLRERFQDPYTAFLMALTLGLFSFLAVVALGRAGFPLAQAKSSRYAEIAIFLPLLSIVLFHRFPKYGFVGKWMIVGLIFVGFYDGFQFSVYKGIQERRFMGKNCVEDFLRHPERNPEAMCLALYPKSLMKRIILARQLGVNFTR